MSDVRYEFVGSAPVDAIVELYRAGRWWREGEDRPEDISALIRGSYRFMVAVTAAGRIVGMGRALSDGVSDAYIQDVVVVPEHRGCGIGAEIVRRLAEECASHGILWVGLIAEPGTDPFYERLGFATLPDHRPMRYRLARR